MPLSSHLRELRNRLFKSAVAIVGFGILGWVYYDQIMEVLLEPIEEYIAEANAQGREAALALSGITSAFALKLNVAMFTGIVLGTPVWTYQLWAFLRPGLHRRERRYAVGFVVAATPLFLTGIALAYLLVPGALNVLLGLTPEDVTNLPTVSEYLSFVLRFALAFGIGFLLPVLVVALNFAGVLTADRLRTWWRGAVLGVFLFAAIITPTPDPWNMTLLAVPMLVLLLIAWGITWWHDRRVGERETEWTDDDDAPIAAPEPIDAPAPLDAPSSRAD